MATTVPKDGIRTIISGISGLPEAFVLWDGEPKGPVVYGQDARRIVLNVVARRRVGEDEEKREYIPDPDNLPDGLLVRTTYSGQRVLTISVRAENYGQEEGFDLLEAIRTMLGADVNRLALNVLGVALSSIADVRNIDGTAGNRKISVSQMDVILNQRVDRVIEAQGDTYIESLEGELDVTA